MIQVQSGDERGRNVMKAIVAVIAWLGLMAAMCGPRGAGPGEHQPLDLRGCSASVQRTQGTDEVAGSIIHGLLERVPGGRILVGIVSVWVLVGLAVLTIAVGEESTARRSQFPIGHHRYADYSVTGQSWRNDTASAYKPARVQAQKPGRPK